MTRVPTILAAGLLAAAAGPAAGQFHSGVPSHSGLGHLSGAAVAPGQTFYAPPTTGFAGGYLRAPAFGYPVPVSQFGAGGFGIGAYSPYFYGGGFGFGFPGYLNAYPSDFGTTVTGLYDGQVAPATGLVGLNVGPTPAQSPPVVYPIQPAGTGGNRFNNVLSGELTATLVVSLPADGEVWFDGVKQKQTGTTFTLTSPPLRAGDSHRYDVKAEWTVDGKKYGADRVVRVAAGDRQKLTLILGDLVK